MAKVTMEDVVAFAKLAEQTERYEDMVEEVKKMVSMEPNLNVEQRNLLSVAYKNVVGQVRAARRALSADAVSEDQKDAGFEKLRVAYIRDCIVPELRTWCSDLLKLLDTILLPACTEDESRVFYLKMKGDYYRYLAEVDYDNSATTAAAASSSFSSSGAAASSGDKKGAGSGSKATSADLAKEAYTEATELAAHRFNATHPVRLGLALNFSVFVHEIGNDPDAAIKLAKNAFDDAIGSLEELSHSGYQDATLIMQLIRDNITLWSAS